MLHIFKRAAGNGWRDGKGMGEVMHRYAIAGYVLLASVCLLAVAGPAGAVTTVFTADTVIGSGNTTYDGNDIVVRGCTLTVDGSHCFNSLTIQRSPSNVPGVLTHTGGAGVCDLAITHDMTIQGPDGPLVGSRVDVRGKGYPSEQGPGAGQSGPLFGAGGGYGGRGSDVINAVGGQAYTSLPAFGSGGGRGGSSPGGSGGGAIQLNVTGTLTVNGSILADGGDGQLDGGAGSGGSVWMDVGALAGSGTISANGGNASNPNAGGGGGGRIEVRCDSNSFTGSITAYGGLGGSNGGAGVIVTYAAGGYQAVVADNGGRSGALTPLGGITYYDVSISGGATAYFSSGASMHSIHVGPAGRLVPSGSLNSISLAVTGDVTVDAGGSICADGMGYPSQDGSGRGNTYSPGGVAYGTGAGHAGYGGDVYTAAGGSTYGYCDSSGNYGSGGGVGMTAGVTVPGGSGGGAIVMTVQGILTVNGSISANGSAAQYPAGGGSGGTVWLSVGALAGSGAITADGGDASSTSGGGGGGRVVVTRTTDSFSGILRARGGVGLMAGGAGTVYTAGAGQSVAWVVMDNAGVSGALTRIDSHCDGKKLVVVGGAAAALDFALALDSLRIESTGSLVPTKTESKLSVTVAKDAVVAAGGRISVDGKGSASEQGNGPGSRYTLNGITYGTGAGHGGVGGGFTALPGGNPYGQPQSPTYSGSGGGKGILSGVTVSGGSGGGSIVLNVSGALTVDGSITANGNPAPYPAGGGSGGSVWLTAGTLAGAGVISANGGAASTSSGGGGGGRVALVCTTNAFTGSVTAYGGAGAQAGGAGTVYSKIDQYIPSLVIDNGGASGALTPFGSAGSYYNLTIRGKAVACPQTNILAGLRVAADGKLVPGAALSAVDLTIYGDAVVDTGGSISADAKGYSSEQGPGRGLRYPLGSIGYGTGGGYGGFGGAVGTAAGGVAYGSSADPSYGSGGGSGALSSGPVAGGSGGGFVKLNVFGLLTVNGSISANGEAATYPAGGGSGGGITITAPAIAGSGSISANGGAGTFASGGGGGGRIAIFYTSTTFSGATTAYGASGLMAGGAGTIYSTVGGQTACVMADNGGLSGAGTGIDSYCAKTNLTITNGAVAPMSGTFSLVSLRVGPGGQLVQAPSTTSLVLMIDGSATVDAGGSITATGKGGAGGVGTGKGGSGQYYGGGGAYGGAGGAGYAVAGGAPYGPVSASLQIGSGGGYGGNPTDNPGGAGGGYLSLNVSRGTLTVNGSITANGCSGVGTGGGGSGGGINIVASTLAGNGVISANGGNTASPYAGAGGGGRICVRCTTNSFTGAKTAYGGIGYGTGAAGTIYIGSQSGPGGSLVVDNGSRIGAPSPMDSLPPLTDVTISGCAAVYPLAAMTLRSLRLATGGRIFEPADKPGIEFRVNQDVVIDSDCSISCDGAVYGSSGPGWGGSTSTYGGGGGYGGKGGDGFDPSAFGGLPYGSSLKPADFGSRGGRGGSYEGGLAGGKIKMTVNGTLKLDGTLSANGLTGGYTGGGGSGGSIWVIADSLSGTGSVSADGGEAMSMNAGGGGGGRICLAYVANNSLNVANVTARGGDGYIPGEDGTVVIDQIQPPAVADIPDHYAVTGLSYTGPTPELTGDMTGVTWSLIAGPPDMGIDSSTGVVSWADPVTAESPYTVTIRATNLVGDTDKTWQLTVVDNPKLVPDDGIIRMGDLIVTAQFAGCMYVQPANRLWGIRINDTAGSYPPGNQLTIAGAIATNPDLERCIDSSLIAWSGTASCAPIGVPLKYLGGGSYQYDPNTGAGQIGVAGGAGLNNIGLLVKVWGRVTEIDPGGAWFVIDDGSGSATKCVMPDGVTADPEWDYVSVTGISSCKSPSVQIDRLIRVRAFDGVVAYP